MKYCGTTWRRGQKVEPKYLERTDGIVGEMKSAGRRIAHRTRRINEEMRNGECAELEDVGFVEEEE